MGPQIEALHAPDPDSRTSILRGGEVILGARKRDPRSIRRMRLHVFVLLFDEIVYFVL